MLCLTMFGTMSATLRYGDAILPLSLSPRVAELLAYLALGRGRFHCRNDIAGSLWDPLEDEATPGCVSTVVWRLRRSLERAPAKPGDYIVTNKHGAVGLNGREPVGLDVAEFESSARPVLAKPIEALGYADCHALEEAVALYSADPLTEFSTPWALRERERLRAVYISALERIVQYFSRLRRFEEAIAYARRLVAVDALREDMQRQLMHLFASNGQRALAIKQYEICRVSLQRELGIMPMRETRDLYRQLSADVQPAVAAGALKLATPDGGTVADQIRLARALLARADRELADTLDQLTR